MKVTDKYVFFWDGVFSQWYPSKFKLDGVEYVSCEQYMMHKKALMFEDLETAYQILKTASPAEQKALGKKVRGFDRDRWDKECATIVYNGNYAKFSQNPEMRKQLVTVGDKTLVEASPVDFIWGIGMYEGDSTNENPKNWKGMNLLGSILTLVKNELIEVSLPGQACIYTEKDLRDAVVWGKQLGFQVLGAITNGQPSPNQNEIIEEFIQSKQK